MTPSTRGYSDDGERGLTPRMRDVLRSAAQGSSARETGRELHLSESTIKTVRAAACARLEARNVTAAVAIAYRRGDL